MFNHTKVHLDVFPADRLGTPVANAIHSFKFPGFIYIEQSGLSMYGNAATCSGMVFRKVTKHNRVGLAGGGRGGREGRSRVLTENAESAQMRGKVSRKTT